MLTDDSLPLPGSCELNGILLHVHNILSVAAQLDSSVSR